MNENHKQKSLDTIAEVMYHLATAHSEVADAQEALEALHAQIASAELSLCGRMVPVTTPPPHVTHTGADKFSLTLTAAQLGALSRAVESELLSFVNNDFQADTPTYRTTLTVIFQAIRAAERALTPYPGGFRTA